MKTTKMYSHKELASLYFPNILLKSASTQLTRWIHRDEDLLNELTAAGYRKGTRVYTPRQQSILIDHLGDPDTWSIK